MPWVTVSASPSGEPIAITASPTARSSELPSCSTRRVGTSILSTARSVFGSLPTISAFTRLPSLNTTAISWPSSTAPPSVTTCLLVRM